MPPAVHAELAEASKAAATTSAEDMCGVESTENQISIGIEMDAPEEAIEVAEVAAETKEPQEGQLSSQQIETLAGLISSEMRKQHEDGEFEPLLLEPEGVQRIALELTEYDRGDTGLPKEGMVELDFDFTTVAPLEEQSQEDDFYRTTISEQEYTVRKVYVNILLSLALAAAIFIPLGFLIATLVGPELTVREYFIAIDEVEWDYAPMGVDACQGQDFGYTAQLWTSPDSRSTGNLTRIGSKYTKSVYQQYTDSSFTVKTARPAHWQHLGFLGPVIRAEVGDKIRVTLRNNARFDFSLHARGDFGNKANEGIRYNDDTQGYHKKDDVVQPYGTSTKDCTTDGWNMPTNSIDSQDNCAPFQVKPGQQRIYDWLVEETDGPQNGMSSQAWIYHSQVGGQGPTPAYGAGKFGFASDTNAALMGAIIVTAKGQARADTLMPSDVDREFVMMWTVSDENQSPYLNQNIFDHVIMPNRGTVKPGWVSFSSLDKARVLQYLFRTAVKGADKLSYTEAVTEVQTSITEQREVYQVKGVFIRVWFTSTQFDPTKFDAKYGFEAAQHVLDELLWAKVDYQDPLFLESNKMHAMNGYIYCNQPGLDMNQHEKVRWYSLAVGQTWDMHTPHWHGHTVLTETGQRSDEFEMVPGTVRQVDMSPEQTGIWSVHCHINDHMHAGMWSLYTVGAPSTYTAVSSAAATTATTPAPPPTGTTRTYYIAAEDVLWSYVDPLTWGQGVDKCSGAALTSEQLGSMQGDGTDKIGYNYTKARYVEYTDATFTTRKAVPSEWEHMGILGPPIHAEVGDTIVVHYKNNARFNNTMHPHGVLYTKANEGAPYADSTASALKQDDSVAPGQSYTYTWQVPETAGPGPQDPSSVVWLYHSHKNEINDTNTGLVGGIVVSRAGQADASGRPSDIDQEFFVMPMVFDEGKNRYTQENIQQRLPSFAGNKAGISSEERDRLYYQLQTSDYFKKYNKKYTINGKAYCSLPNMAVSSASSRVRWYMLSLGDEHPHTPTWQGHTLDFSGHRVDTLELMAASMLTADMVQPHPGSWLLFCNTQDYVRKGMKSLFSVAPVNHQLTGGAGVEPDSTYYIAADEVEWDYLPEGKDMCQDPDATGNPAFSEEYIQSNKFETEDELLLKPGVHRIGSRYIKGQYREYNDDSFTKRTFGSKSRFNSPSTHLGLLGPVLRGVPGTVIKIVFKNRLRFPCTLFVRGAEQLSEDAGAPVMPGGSATWYIRTSDQAAPGSKDKSSVGWIYESQRDIAAAAVARAPGNYPANALDNFADFNAGLFGPLLVTQGRHDREDGSPKDVHTEFVTVFSNIDENKSPYIDVNIHKFALQGYSVLKTDPAFKESNRMASINGLSFCNLPGLVVRQGRDSRWYTMALGDHTDVHAPSWSGQSGTRDGPFAGAGDMVELLPGASKVFDIHAHNRGVWLYEDEVQNNVRHGAKALMKVAQTLTEICPIKFYSKC